MKVGIDLRTWLTKFMNKEFLRFVFVGGINTGATYIFYLVLLIFFDYSVSYTISYVAGILISFYLNTFFVFKEKVSFKKFLQFPLVYLVQYLINLLMILVFVELFNVSKQIVPLIVIVITIPITFVLSKLIIRGK